MIWTKGKTVLSLRDPQSSLSDCTQSFSIFEACIWVFRGSVGTTGELTVASVLGSSSSNWHGECIHHHLHTHLAWGSPDQHECSSPWLPIATPPCYRLSGILSGPLGGGRRAFNCMSSILGDQAFAFGSGSRMGRCGGSEAVGD